VQQLSGLDSSFLNIETPTTYGHVASLLVLDPSYGGAGDLRAALHRTFEERLHLLEVYRRKLMEVPLGLDHPYWVDDPNLDLEFHLRELALPAPGDDEQLGEQVARIISRPLDRSRPLWEIYVITGLANGRVGVLTKLHHATIDGVSGAELLHVLLDSDPEGSDVEPPAEPWQPKRAPTPLELLGRTIVAYSTKPQKAVQLQVRLLRTIARLTGNPVARETLGTAVPVLRRIGILEPSTGEERPNLPTRPAPRTPFNRPITPHRRFAFRTLSLSDAQTVKRAFDVTVNDVVMALCGGALRRYLAGHGELPEQSLVAMVPVSVRAESGAGESSNQVTGVIAPLHTDLADAADRLVAIHRSMAAAKELQRAIPASMLTDVTQFAPPALMGRAARLASRIRLTDRFNPPVNLIVSNVPGPRQPLYLSGARMEHFYPVSNIADGQGLNMTVQSYLDNLDFGLIACRELVPDLWTLCDGLEETMDELLKAAAAV
jgi:diacylglycerol O-acyltransferase / wax synthase